LVNNKELIKKVLNGPSSTIEERLYVQFLLWFNGKRRPVKFNYYKKPYNYVLSPKVITFDRFMEYLPEEIVYPPFEIQEEVSDFDFWWGNRNDFVIGDSVRKVPKARFSKNRRFTLFPWLPIYIKKPPNEIFDLKNREANYQLVKCFNFLIYAGMKEEAYYSCYRNLEEYYNEK